MNATAFQPVEIHVAAGAPTRWALELHLGDGTQRTVALRTGRLGIGSSSRCDVVLSDEGVEPLHAALLVDADRVRCIPWTVPTLLNGNEFSESELQLGDALQLGTARLQLVECAVADGGQTSAANTSVGAALVDPPEASHPLRAWSVSPASRRRASLDRLWDHEALPTAAFQRESSAREGALTRRSRAALIGRRRCRALIEELRRSRAEIKTLQERLDAADEQRTTQLDEALSDVTELRANFAEERERCCVLQHELRNAEAARDVALEQLDAAIEEAGMRDLEIENLQRRLSAELSDSSDAVEAGPSAEWLAELESAQDENQGLRSQLLTLQQTLEKYDRLQDSQADAVAEVERLRGEGGELGARFAELESTLEALEIDLAESLEEKAAFEAAADAMDRELSAVRQGVLGTHEELEAVERYAAEQSELIDLLQAELEEVTATQAAHLDEQEEQVALLEQLAARERELEAAQRDAKALAQEAERWASQRESLNEELEIRDEAMRSAQVETERVSAELEGLRAELEATQRRAAELEECLELESDSSSVDDGVDGEPGQGTVAIELEERVRSLETELAASVELAQALSNEKELMQQEIDRHEAAMLRLSEQSGELAFKFTESESRLKRLVEENDRLMQRAGVDEDPIAAAERNDVPNGQGSFEASLTQDELDRVRLDAEGDDPWCDDLFSNEAWSDGPSSEEAPSE
ncbi:MAG: FHA domain-containing protein, partial [Planctomycetales bacterium]|nr:FHA domain-containing protein [Planctomycetales bacterium]